MICRDSVDILVFNHPGIPHSCELPKDHEGHCRCGKCSITWTTF